MKDSTGALGSKAMGAQVLRPCGHVCAQKNGSVVDDVIETCAHLQTEERSTGTGLGGRRPQPRHTALYSCIPYICSSSKFCQCGGTPPPNGMVSPWKAGPTHSVMLATAS